MSLINSVHKKILVNEDEICSWFNKKSESVPFSFYSSFDLRESKNKIAPVDANIYPAGFNNICQADREEMISIFDSQLSGYGYAKNDPVGLIPEEHTGNPYYWDNIITLKETIKSTGRDCEIIVPIWKEEYKNLKSASGREAKIIKGKISDGCANIAGVDYKKFILNNDLSNIPESLLFEGSALFNPPMYMGWHKRRKADFFLQYNKLVEEWAPLIGEDPFTFQIRTDVFSEFSIEDEPSRKKLSERSSEIFEELSSEYEKRNYSHSPYFYVKNSKGTYGLGVIEVKDPEEILSWNYKARKKMKAAKGGGRFSEVIIQEGIPTSFFVDDLPAEPVIYTLGPKLVGGFLRTNSRKNAQDNLNSPGAIFKRLCFSDFEEKKEGKVFENVYGWISKLGALAIGLEIKASS